MGVMDREKVIKDLEEYRDRDFVREGTSFFDNDPRYRKMIISDAIAMLREREEIVPYIDIDEAKCPICKVRLTRQELIGDDVLFEDFFDYCPKCGRHVKWE